MNKSSIKNALKSIQTTVSKHSPEILTGIGIAGMITTTVLAVRATPKALVLIEEAESKKGEKLTPVEVVKAAWKPYVGPVITGACSIACVIGSNTVSTKRNAALATAYKLSEEAFTIYKEKVVETIGEKKEQAIKDKVDKERLERNPVSNNQVIIASKGDTLFYDVISGRYFKSDIETIRKVVNDLNKRMMYENYISLSDFYDEIGLSHTKNSDELGWNINNEGLIEIDFGSQIADDGTPCIVIDYYISPRYDFSKLM